MLRKSPKDGSEGSRSSQQDVTYSDELEHLVNEDDGCAEIQYSLPLSPVKRRDGKEGLASIDQNPEVMNGISILTVKKGM